MIEETGGNGFSSSSPKKEKIEDAVSLICGDGGKAYWEEKKEG